MEIKLDITTQNCQFIAFRRNKKPIFIFSMRHFFLNQVELLQDLLKSTCYAFRVVKRCRQSVSCKCCSKWFDDCSFLHKTRKHPLNISAVIRCRLFSFPLLYLLFAFIPLTFGIEFINIVDPLSSLWSLRKKPHHTLFCWKLVDITTATR